MTIKQLKQAIKEMKEICKFEDAKTNIFVSGNPNYCSNFDYNKIQINTTINNTNIVMWKEVK